VEATQAQIRILFCGSSGIQGDDQHAAVLTGFRFFFRLMSPGVDVDVDVDVDVEVAKENHLVPPHENTTPICT
jgi:hypothetical protein